MAGPVTSRPRQEAESAPPARDPVPDDPRRDEVPYPVTLVHDEGEWLATIDALPGCTARGVTPDEMRIGLPVQVIFERTTEGVTLPAFVRTQ